MKLFLGVTTGQFRAVAILAGSNAIVFSMHGTVSQVAELIGNHTSPGDILVFEQPQMPPLPGVTSDAIGFEAIADGLGLRYVAVHPDEWKKAMGLNIDKTSSIIEAERIFPDVALVPSGCSKPSDGIAEALLIAEWARRSNL